jgi:hypothetical protein
MADLSDTLALTTTREWVPIGGFTTADSQVGTFLQPGTTFDGQIFTTTRQGFYFLGFNVRVDGLTSGWFHCNLFQNGVANPDAQGLSTLRGSNNYDYWTFSTSGVVQAPANTNYSMYVRAQSDTSYNIYSFSSFTAFEMFPEEGVYAMSSANTAMKNNDYNSLANWKTDDVQSFLLGGTFNVATGDYTVKDDGIFLLNFNVRISNVASQAGGFVRALIDINNQNELDAGLHTIQG